MLSKSQKQAYQVLLTMLQQFQVTVASSNLNVADLQKQLQITQEFFQQRVINEEKDVNSETIARRRSLLTEIHRSLKLLGTDILFLKSSRQPSTTATRLEAIRDRLAKLIGYCETILNLS